MATEEMWSLQARSRASSARTGAHEASTAPHTPLQPQPFPAALCAVGEDFGPFRGVIAAPTAASTLLAWQLRCADHR